MPYIDDKKYDALAKDAVTAFINENKPLNDSVYKMAHEIGMLPDQVKQLVWRTNTLAHLTLFEKKAEDKNIEFPVADASAILKRLYNEDSAEKTAAAYTTRVKERTIDFFTPLNEFEKTAEEQEFKAIPPFDSNVRRNTPETVYNNINLLRKVANELSIRIHEHKENYLQKLSELEEKIRKIYTAYNGSEKIATFAHEAVTRHGDDGKKILHNMNVKIPSNAEKTAALADPHNPLHNLLDDIVRYRRLTIKTARALQLLQDKINKL